MQAATCSRSAILKARRPCKSSALVSYLERWRKPHLLCWIMMPEAGALHASVRFRSPGLGRGSIGGAWRQDRRGPFGTLVKGGEGLPVSPKATPRSRFQGPVRAARAQRAPHACDGLDRCAATGLQGHAQAVLNGMRARHPRCLGWALPGAGRGGARSPRIALPFMHIVRFEVIWRKAGQGPIARRGFSARSAREASYPAPGQARARNASCCP